MDADGLLEYSQLLRRDFHKNPELGFKETRTAEIISKELNKHGYRVKEKVGKTGVEGYLEGNTNVPVTLLRFDMDALPITEEITTPYASKNTGVMHACGHDGHMAIGLCVAKLLSKNKEKLSGSLKFCFQPAEEILEGAKAMIADGVLNNPNTDHALGLHLWNEKPVGWISISPGPVMAGFDEFSIKIIGKGGHGAIPNQSIDPIIASSQIINSLQSIVSRNVPPIEAAVISLTQINAGTAFNIIPETVEMHGSIRTFDEDVRNVIITRFKQIVNQMAEAFECKAVVEIESLAPPVINHEIITNIVQKTVKRYLPELTIDTNYRTMVSEDMAFYTEKIPSCFIFVGSSNKEKGYIYGQHHPKYDFDENALVIGIKIIALTTIALMEELISV